MSIELTEQIGRFSKTKGDGDLADLAVSQGLKQKGKQWHHFSHAAPPYVQLLAVASRSQKRIGGDESRKADCSPLVADCLCWLAFSKTKELRA